MLTSFDVYLWLLNYTQKYSGEEKVKDLKINYYV